VNLTGEYRIAALRRRVWHALNDPRVLNVCIPGCQHLKLVSPTEIDAAVLAQLGPVKATFATRITLTELNPPTSYTLSGEGKDGAAGFGRGEAKVSLRDDNNGTFLNYTDDLKVGGKLAQIGSRLVEGAARKLADESFGKFATQLDQQAVRRDTATTGGTAPASARSPLSAGRWLTILLAVAATLALLWWLTR
jgi:carbon monoxide dehydrogenase subunit G